MRFVRTAVALTVVCLGVVLSGCTASKPGAHIDLSINADGSIEQRVAVRGIEPDPQVQSDLESAKWSVKSGSSEVTFVRRFANLQDFSDNAGALQAGLARALGGQLGRDVPPVDPQVLSVRSTNYGLARRYTVSYEIPSIDLRPTKCGSCGGTGQTDCYSCDGDGQVLCSTCGGTGISYGYQCSSCSGTGKVACTTCNGTGKLDCDRCDGTGQVSDEESESYDQAVGRAKVAVSMKLPGVAAKGEGSESTSWEMEGEDALRGAKLTASSWIIDWRAVAIVAGVLLLIIAVVVWLIVRKIKKALAARAAAKAEKQAAAAQMAGVQGTRADSAMRYCPQCGTQNGADVAFCRSCGHKFN